MKQQQQRHNPLRKIAETQLHAIFGDSLSCEVENELATALVRQWITYDGHAGLFADQARFWFQVKKTGTGYDMSRQLNNGCILDPFVRDRGIDPADVPSLLHRLNVSQTAEVETLHGQRLRFVIKPEEKTISVEDISSSSSE
jgi:hypothetical protein